ncbi:hypothetical protein ACFYZ8_34565 [Streptomyces sp. NPDC001668]|uniref:hypothetical protein n=1 Tax=Streptomyces sp. NPDC001668 TaxID=3364598 RepID=UPI0036AAE3EC
MAVREGPRTCAVCAADLPGASGGPAYLVSGAVRRGRRWVGGRLLVCARCYGEGGPDPVTGLSRPDAARRTARVRWVDLIGRGEVMAPTPCVACGLLVVRRAEKLLAGVTCSRACRTSLTRIRNGGKGSGRPCGACGTPVTAGRADSSYCGPPCRQKAYRRRSASRPASHVPDPVAELTKAMAPFVAGNAEGLSQSLYKALYRLQTAHRDGPQGQETALARLTAMDPCRLKIPDTADGRRLRAALRSAHNWHTQP